MLSLTKFKIKLAHLLGVPLLAVFIVVATVPTTTAAAVEFESAIGLDDGYFLAKVNLAGLYRTKLDRLGRAIELYREALQLNPTENERAAIIKVLKELGENVNNAMVESAETAPVV